MVFFFVMLDRGPNRSELHTANANYTINRLGE